MTTHGAETIERRARVVVVDDDSSLLSALADLLQDGGYEVVGTATDGVSAAKVICDVRPDVAVADLRMPGMTGVELAMDLTAKGVTTPVIVLSAYDDASLQIAAIRADAVAYLVKGCPAKDLFGAIDSAARLSS